MYCLAVAAKCTLEALFTSSFSIKVFIRWCGSVPHTHAKQRALVSACRVHLCVYQHLEKMPKYVQSQTVLPLKCRQSIPTNPSLCQQTLTAMYSTDWQYDPHTAPSCLHPKKISLPNYPVTKVKPHAVRAPVHISSFIFQFIVLQWSRSRTELCLSPLAQCDSRPGAGRHSPGTAQITHTTVAQAIHTGLPPKTSAERSHQECKPTGIQCTVEKKRFAQCVAQLWA